VALKLDPRRCSRPQPRQAVLSQQRLSLGCAPVETVKTVPAFMSAVRLRRLSPADGTVRHKQRQFQCERERYCGHEEPNDCRAIYNRTTTIFSWSMVQYSLPRDGRRKDRLKAIHYGMRDSDRCDGLAGKKPNVDSSLLA
jgi:hypothetical protein